jgi:hypothetical protein
MNNQSEQWERKGQSQPLRSAQSPRHEGLDSNCEEAGGPPNGYRKKRAKLALRLPQRRSRKFLREVGNHLREYTVS